MDRDYSMKLEFKELFTKEEASFLMFSFWYILKISINLLIISAS